MRVSHEPPPPNRRRSLYALLRMRPAYAEHSVADEAILRRLAAGAEVLVEIGTAEGGSALALRESMPPTAHLWCVDPYVSRIPGLSPREQVAHQLVGRCRNGTVTWVKAFSVAAAASWDGPPIDLLYVDGDHRYEAVLADWRGWSPHLAAHGVAVFDDAVGEAAGWGPGRVVRELAGADGAAWRVVETGDRYAVVARA